MRETGTAAVTTPREVDERLEALWLAEERKRAEIDQHGRALHAGAGDREHTDRSRGYGRGRQVWGMTAAEVTAKLTALADAGETRPAALLAKAEELRAELAAIQAEAAELNKIYQARPWSRFFPCLASSGHIHSSLRGCHTIQPTTLMSWYPSLSGKTDAEAVAELGEALCTHCFPSAPVAWTAKTLTQVKNERTAGERAEAAAAKAAAKAVKELTRPEWFEGARGRVTTVAGAKQALRDEREYAHYRGIGQPHSCWSEAQEAAAAARRVLLARGVPEAELDTIVARAEAKQQKEWKDPNRGWI